MIAQPMKTLRYGFSLLELSVVLAIIALIAGVGLNMANGALKAADRITTQERIATVKMAIESYAKNYGFLPCPADRALTPTSALFGVEARAAGNLTCTANGTSLEGSAGNIWLGAVPVRTLGLTDIYAGDAWGNKINYLVFPVSANPNTYSSSISKLSVQTQTGGGGFLDTYFARTVASVPFNSVTQHGTLIQVHVTSGTGNYGSSYPITMSGSLVKGSYIPIYISPGVFDLQSSVWLAGYAGDTGTFVTADLSGSSGASYALISNGADQIGGFPMLGSSVPTNRTCNPAFNSIYPNEYSNCYLGYYSVVQDSDYNDGAAPAWNSLHFDDYVTWGSNELSRAPDVGIGTMYASCPVGTGACEPWCATCTVNYPGGGSTTPPATITSNPFIYKKVLTSNSTSCSATCFWGGTTATGIFIKAP